MWGSLWENMMPRHRAAADSLPNAKLRNGEVHPQTGAGNPGLTVAVAGAVALVEPVGTALAVCGAGQTVDCPLHQALEGEAPQQIGIGASLHQRPKAPHGCALENTSV
jgi:hypothetical protein